MTKAMGRLLWSFRSETILHVMQFLDEANRFIEGEIFCYLLQAK